MADASPPNTPFDLQKDLGSNKARITSCSEVSQGWGHLHRKCKCCHSHIRDQPSPQGTHTTRQSIPYIQEDNQVEHMVGYPGDSQEGAV